MPPNTHSDPMDDGDLSFLDLSRNLRASEVHEPVTGRQPSSPQLITLTGRARPPPVRRRRRRRTPLLLNETPSAVPQRADEGEVDR